MIHPPTVLAVDDEIFNLEILSEWLADWGCRVDTAEHGQQAVQRLEGYPDRYDLVLLDRMMPKMGGLEVLAYMRQHPVFKNIPVVLQSAAATKDDIRTALAAGAFYYLSKPFDQAALIAMLKTALRDAMQDKHLRFQLSESVDERPEQDLYRFRTPGEAVHLAVQLARRSGRPGRVVRGLFELLLNAVEHGNLGLGYEEKTKLIDSGRWWDEMSRRVKMPEYANKHATASVTAGAGITRYLIKDQGDGFDHQPYLQIEPRRASHNHGRGITFANLGFDELQYRGAGNEVQATVKNP